MALRLGMTESSVGVSLLGDVGVAADLHVVFDRQGLGTVVRTQARANGR
jgi:hypothetical protein